MNITIQEMFHQQKNLILNVIQSCFAFNFGRFLYQVSTSPVETRIYNLSQCKQPDERRHLILLPMNIAGILMDKTSWPKHA